MSTSDKLAHVLIVDDEPDIRESVAELLEDEGYMVSEASDGAQALVMLESSREKPDVILLDLKMPNMNGYEFRQRQLHTRDYAAIPVVVMSADENAREVASQIQAAAVVRKTGKIQVLLNVLNDTLPTR